jgi:hypothetical protein
MTHIFLSIVFSTHLQKMSPALNVREQEWIEYKIRGMLSYTYYILLVFIQQTGRKNILVLMAASITLIYSAVTMYLWHSEDLAPWYSLIIKAKRCSISQLYFGKELYIFRTDLLSIIRSLNTVFTAIGICHTGYVACLLAAPSRPR